MRLALLITLLGCSGSTDACDPFPDRTCITLEVRGAAQVDQIHASSVELVVDGATPPSAGAPFGLPVQTAVLPADPDFFGPFTLDVQGLLLNTVVGGAQISAQFTYHEHRRLVADLGGAAVDLAGADFALPPGADLSRPPDLAHGTDQGVVAAPHWVAQPTGDPQQLARFWASSSTDLYASGYHGGILHSTGNGVWNLQTTPAANTVILSGLWGSGPGDIYAGGGISPDHVILHSTGNGTWQKQTLPVADGIVGLGGFDATHVWASSQGSMLHLVGGTWQSETSGVPNTFIGAVFAAGTNAVYACGFQVMLFSTGNGAWAGQPLGGVSANDVWANNPFDLYAAAGTSVMHSDGSGAWVPQGTGLSSVSCVGGNGPNDVYAGGHTGIAHSTGNGMWTKETVDMTGINQITSIFVLPNGDAWATTDEGPGVVLHRQLTP